VKKDVLYVTNHTTIISKPFKILNKENYLCIRIAWRNHKFFLNKNKKYELAKKYIALTIPFTLNEIYKLYNYSKKFDELIKEFQSINWENVDKKVAENFLKSMSFIFDVTKKSDPISYAVFYSMQYIFWQVVVVGGILTDMKLSAKLLSNSLVIFDEENTVKKTMNLVVIA